MIGHAVTAKMKLYGAIGVAIVLVALLCWAFRLDHLRAGWKDKFDVLTEEAAVVLVATRSASDNPDLKWGQAAGQIVAIGESNRALKDAITNQNARVDELAAEAVRLKAQAVELQRIADRARAQRKAALERLEDMSITPGTRSDCMTLIKEAEAALDLVREAGL